MVAFERLARPPEVPAARRRIELATLWCALAGLLGTAPALSLYVARHADGVSLSSWTQLITQVTTFVVVGGAWCGLLIGAGLSFPGRASTRFAAAVALGAVGAAVMGAIGAPHFGLMRLPYFGGPEILVSIGLGVCVAAAGLASTEARLSQTPLAWWACARLAIAPAPLVALLLVFGLLAEPQIVSLHLDAMRELTSRIGLMNLGAFGGALVGMLGSAWLASSALLAQPNAATSSPAARSPASIAPSK